MGQKVESGDGRPLEPVRGWEKLWRSSFGADIDGARYDIDLNFFDFDEKVRLFVGGRLSETRGAPAKFPIRDGSVSVAFGMYGVRRAQIERASGDVIRMEPNSGTLEHWRRETDRRYPVASGIVSMLSWLVLVLGLLVGVTELLDLAGPHLGLEDGSPVTVPEPFNGVIGGLGIVAALDRALMLRHHWLLD